MLLPVRVAARIGIIQRYGSDMLISTPTPRSGGGGSERRRREGVDGAGAMRGEDGQQGGRRREAGGGATEKHRVELGIMPALIHGRSGAQSRTIRSKAEQEQRSLLTSDSLDCKSVIYMLCLTYRRTDENLKSARAPTAHRPPTHFRHRADQ